MAILHRCLSCCFPVGRRTSMVAEADSGSGSGGGRVVRSPSSWLKSEIPELKEKCRGIIARIGRRGGRRHSDDFSYDPLSYSMNFDDGSSGDADSRHRSFTSKLAPSPAATEIACVR